MSLLMRFKERMHHFALEKQLNSLHTTRVPKDFEDSKTIALLFDATDPEQRYQIMDFENELIKRGKYVRKLAFINSKEPNENLAFKYFNKTTLDFYLKPTGSEVEDFLNTPFDILINLSMNANIPCEYICALSSAHLRVGPFTEKTYCYDLMIDTSGGNKDLRHFINQVDFFLRRMNSKKKHEAAAI